MDEVIASICVSASYSWLGFFVWCRQLFIMGPALPFDLVPCPCTSVRFSNTKVWPSPAEYIHELFAEAASPRLRWWWGEASQGTPISAPMANNTAV